MNKKGMGLIEVLVAVGILSIIVLAITSIMEGLSKESKSLEEKLALLELESNAIKIFSQNSQCSAQVAQNTSTHDFLNLTATTEIELPRLFFGPASAPKVIVEKNSSVPGFKGGRMRVQNIVLKSITAGPVANSYIGNIEVNLDLSTLTRSLKPVTVQNVQINVTPSPTLKNAIITSCGDLSGCTWNNQWKCTCGADTSGGHEAKITMCLYCVDNKIVNSRIQSVHVSNSESCTPCPPSGKTLFPGGSNSSKACDFISNN